MGVNDFRRKIYLEHTKKILSIFLVCLFAVCPQILNAALSCSVSSTCNSPDVVLFRVSAASNAHAELASQSNYTPKVCCTGITGLDNVCSGNYAVVARLDSTTNAHIEQNDQGNYANDVCISAPGGYGITVAYQNTNCSGYDTIATSISGSTNAHTGSQAAYTKKICLTLDPPSLTFSIDDNSIGFSSLSSSAARYATGNRAGSTSEVEAHQIAVTTNATSGYVITLNSNNTLKIVADTPSITAIGGTNTASSPGTEQFGIRMTVSSGNGTVSSPYADTGFAFDISNFPDEVATGAGDGTSDVYSVRYLANISSTTEAGDYRTNVTYIGTGTF